MPASLLGMLMVAQPSWLFGSAAAAASTLGVAAGILHVGRVWGGGVGQAATQGGIQ